MIRSAGVLTSLVLFGVMIGSASPAQAQTSAVCVFQGLSGEFAPGIPGASGDIFDVERGAYFVDSGLAAGAFCAGVFDGSLPDVGPVEINSVGYYDNILCGGEGFLHDLDGDGTTVAGTGLINGVSIDLSGVGYEIPFDDWAGPILIGPGQAESEMSELMPPDLISPFHGADGDGDGLIPGPMHGARGGAYVGGGEAVITPVPPQSCTQSSTSSFTVQGSFVVTKP